MLINNRVILKDNAVLEDLSALLSDAYFGEKALAIVAAQDALYIGSDYPFNHRFLMLGAKNTQSGSLSVAVWDGEDFAACEDVQDLTAVNGVPLARSGLLRWSLPDDVSWAKVTDSSEITGLSTVKAKAQYWARITFSAAFSFELKYVGFRFARDADLNVYYKDLLKPDMMRAANGGVPMDNWDTFHVAAAEEIIEILRAEEVVYSGNNVLSPEIFTNAACHKLAEMAYSQLRNQERLDFAQEKFKQAMAKKAFDVDRDNDGRLETSEKVASWRLRRQ